MEPPKSRVKLSSTNSDLQSETKGFQEKSLELQIASVNEECPVQIGDSRETSVPAMAVAMDNHLILQEIFKFFSPADLRRTICEVSEKWRDIAGPMIFEYHIQFEIYGVRVETSKGYINPQIEKRRLLSPEAETEYLNTLKRGNAFISLDFRGNPWTREVHEKDNYRTSNFVKKFMSRVYKLSSCDYNHLYQFLCESPSKRDLQLLHLFPNCEEFCVNRLHSLDFFFDVRVPGEMNHVRRVTIDFIGPKCELKMRCFPLQTITILQVIPNLQEMHGIPFYLIREFEKVKKLHLVRSIQFHGFYSIPEWKRNGEEMEAMKAMVQLDIKFKFLRIGTNNIPWRIGTKELPSWPKEEFIKRNKQNFEDLLEIGKDTLQHLALHFDKPENFVVFPANMTALTHITLKIPHSRGSVRFPTNFNFSECFPKVTTISFPSVTLAQWNAGVCLGSWWDSCSEEFRKGIRNLRCYRGLNITIQEKLLQRFPSVNRIEFVDNIDDTHADGIMSD